jgi:hypothetical protein
MISKIHKGFVSSSYCRKLLILLLPVIFITMVLISAISIQHANRLIVSQHKELYIDQCKSIANEISSFVEQAKATTETVLYNDTVYSYIFEDTSALAPFEQMKLQENLNLYAGSICRQNGYKKLRIYVRNKFNDSRDLSSPVRLLHQFYDVVGLENHQLNSRNDQTVVSGVYYDKYNNDIVDSSLTTPIVSVARYIIDGNLENIVGIVAVELAGHKLLDRWTDQYEADERTLKLVDQYSATIDVCGGGNPVHEEGMRIEIPVGDYGWTLVASISQDALYGNNSTIIGSLLLAIMVVGTMLMLVVTFISHGMTRRIVNLTDSISKNAAINDIRVMGNSKIKEQTKGDDEVDKLIRTYNCMLRRIETLSLEFEKSIARETESRLLVLQSQINPHFLYNTLAVIKSYIEISDSAQATGLLMNLSDYFHCTLNHGAYVVSLQEEIKIVSKYLDIQQIVCGTDMEYYIDMPPRADEVLLPKLLLQPFVENAVLYSADDNEQTICIHIRVIMKKNAVLIHIDDNGPGLSEDTRRVLMGERSPYPNEHIGYGIGNVRKRLKLFYGDKAELQFINLPGRGTRVEIRILSLERSDFNDSNCYSGRQPDHSTGD